MIITRLKGGLGNQMFQYSAGLAMATKYKEELKLDVTGYDDPRHISSDTPRKYRLGGFTLLSTVATQEESLKARNPFGIVSKLYRAFDQRVLKNQYIDYVPNFFKKKHSYVEGYFQCEKNFNNVHDKVRESFTLKKEFESEVYKTEVAKIDPTKSVFVHIRRGDYVSDKATNNYWGTCSREYYDKGMSIIKEKIDSPIFYFFSDDIEWVKNEYGNKDNFHFVSNPKLEDYEELMIMSHCAHSIIANSSFSWWAAWLNKNPNKLVIAPKRWLNVEPNPQPNIIPEGWTKI